MQHHFHGVILPHPRFEGERSNNHYPKYSLIPSRGSFITPPQGGKGDTPDSPFFIQPLRGPGLYLLTQRDYLGLSLPHPRGEMERPWTPTILNPASFLESFFHSPPPEEKRNDPSLPMLNTASYLWSIITPP